MNERHVINVGYVTHAFDKIWKPIASREEFLEVLEQPVVRNTISMIRSTASKADKQKLKQKLPAFFFMGRTADCLPGSRVKGNLVPTGLAMIDVDDIENPEEIYERFKENGEFRLLLSHRTPSGHGVRFVVAKPDAVSIEEVQARVAEMLGVKLDTACKDISRLSYACLPEDVFYLDEELFTLSLTELTDNTEKAANEDENENEDKAARGADNTDFPSEYEGVSYKKIVESLTDQMGGAPAHGSRNQFIFAMACLLRHICNDDPDWIMQVIPTFGESRDKVRSSVMSACNRNQTSTMPKLLANAIKSARDGVHDEEKDDAWATPPQMPSNMPRLINLATINVPDYIVPTTSQCIFPALGALISKVCFRYIDNVLHEPSLMHVQVGKTASGKGYINEPFKILAKDIEKADEEGRYAEEQWRLDCSQLGANKKKPARPDVAIRMISPNMTNAIFVQRLIDCARHGMKRMLGKYNEIELLDDLAKGASGGRKEVGKIFRLAFDGDDYGQERFGAQAVSGKAAIRLNWTASSTVQNVKNYFQNMISDGTLNRISFSYIEPQPRHEVPVTGIYEQDYEDALRPYVDNLQRELKPTHKFEDVIKKVSVGKDRLGRDAWQYRIVDPTKPYIIEHADGRLEVFCPEAFKLAEELNQENINTVTLSGDDIYDSFTYRANVIAYKKAMILYLANGCVWDESFADFVRWSEQYDLWCKMQLFSERAKDVMGGESFEGKGKGPENLLVELPPTFTRSNLIELLRRKGMNSNVRYQLHNWIRRGFIKRNADNTFTILAEECGQWSCGQ